MDKLYLRPSGSKIAVSWLVMTFVILLFTIPFNLQKLTDIVAVVMTIGFAFLKTFIFTVIFYRLPFFEIEITDSYVSGLRSFRSWERVRIPIQDIDTQNVDGRFRWLGYYVLKSKSGQTILICAFDQQQFAKLVTILNNKKGFVQ